MYLNFQISLSRMARVCFICIVCLLARMAAAQTSGGVPQAQYDALVAFYNATGGANWSISDNWLSNEPVETWFGVGVVDGKVISLNLSFNNLVGTVPVQTAKLPLTDLAISGNAITAINGFPATLINLDFSSNLVASLPTLPANLQILNGAANALTCLPALPASLVVLNVNFNKLTLLPKLPAGLASLSCATNRIVLLPTLPVTLSNLDCSNNKLIILPKLPAELSTLLANNNFLVALPALPNSLNFIDVSFNQLFALPTLPNNQTLFLQAANNRLTFEDLEPIISRFSFPRQYSPQAEVGFKYTVSVNAGSTLTLSANFAGNTANTRYVWLKDSVVVSDTLVAPTLKITNVQAANAGIYTTRISNKLVPGLVLLRKPITIKVTTAAATQTSLVVYPNPAVNTVQVTKPEGWVDTVSISIASERTGAEVYHKATHTFDKVIDIAKLPAGKYLLRISDGKQSKSVHIVKE